MSLHESTSRERCVRARITVLGSQVIVETEDGKKAVVPQRTLRELIKRFNLCIEESQGQRSLSGNRD